MNIINLKKIVLSCCMFFAAHVLIAQNVVQLQQGKPTSIRGLSVVDDNVAWVSGSKGYIAITRDGGKNWDWQQVKGFEKADFRDIEAFSDKEAVIMSSGTPALILKTIDGGANWKVKYSNTDTTYFFDAMDFADSKHGYILGDPINNKFLLMDTQDGGETWKMFKNRPDAAPNEAAFAASGTCLRVKANRSIYIVSGGGQSNELVYIDKNWVKTPLWFSNKKSSRGAFSFATNGSTNIFVGGDYANNKLTDSVACYTSDQNLSAKMMFPKAGPAGFQSCVEYTSSNTFISTGTPGTNITTDGGKTWSKIDDTSFNVCRMAKHGKLVLLAGDGGKIGILKL